MNSIYQIHRHVSVSTILNHSIFDRKTYLEVDGDKLKSTRANFWLVRAISCLFISVGRFFSSKEKADQIRERNKSLVGKFEPFIKDKELIRKIQENTDDGKISFSKVEKILTIASKNDDVLKNLIYNKRQLFSIKYVMIIVDEKNFVRDTQEKLKNLKEKINDFKENQPGEEYDEIQKYKASMKTFNKETILPFKRYLRLLGLDIDSSSDHLAISTLSENAKERALEIKRTVREFDIIFSARSID